MSLEDDPSKGGTAARPEAGPKDRPPSADRSTGGNVGGLRPPGPSRTTQPTGPKPARKRRAAVGRFTTRRTHPNRRQFLAQGTAFLTAGLSLAAYLGTRPTPLAKAGLRQVLPPGAPASQASFARRCVRCGMCGLVCENGCIRFHGLEAGPLAFTPYLDVRQRACTLCMRCTNICPSGALTPIPAELETIKTRVRMGTAVVERDLCLSYQGRVCGYCHDACPIAHEALHLTPPATPVVLEEGCVGCGRCVEHCPQTPTAIRVIPRGVLTEVQT